MEPSGGRLSGTPVSPQAHFHVRLRNSVIVLIQLMSPPAILLAGAFGVWRLGADLGWTGEFPIPSGVFSRYQVWFAMATAFYFSAAAFERRAARPNTEL